MNDLQTPPEPGVAKLLTGILNDAQELFRQQLALTRREIQEDLVKTRDASIFLVLGACATLLGSVGLVLASGLLLNWLWPTLPLWAAYAIVGGVGTVAGLGLLFVGKKKFDAFNPLPDESFEVMKENLQWTTNPK